MRLFFLLAMVLIGYVSAAEPNSVPPDYDTPGQFEVETTKADWLDSARNRTVPVMMYLPKGDGPFPVIVFSHGLGGSREGYAYLGNHWASWGFVCVHLQHPGSDESVWKDKDTKKAWKAMHAAANAKNAADRTADVRFALDMLEKMNRETPPYKGKFDMNKVGISGHSFGGHTTLSAIGLSGYTGKSSADSRIKAAISMSAPAVKGWFMRKKVYKQIHTPCLHLTGTLDNSPIGDTKAADRRIPYDQISGADQFLVNFNGADHMVFSGRAGIKGDRSRDELFHAYILDCTTAFWLAYLNDDPQAGNWLRQGGFKSHLNGDGTFEEKLISVKTFDSPAPAQPAPSR
jgi:dienelactone hydrolase